MRVVANERIVPVDIDGTLIIHATETEGHITPIGIRDPNFISIADPYSGDICRVLPNQNMIRLFKEELARGAHMLVWSRGGYQWAEAVIKALNLDFEQVTVMSKPYMYMDDLEISEWLDQRVFIPHTGYYKK